jgi:hypothetical protein
LKFLKVTKIQIYENQAGIKFIDELEQVNKYTQSIYDDYGTFVKIWLFQMDNLKNTAHRLVTMEEENYHK